MEIEQLKFGILKIMDSCLTIRTYGSARRNILEDTVKIAGKEMFLEALMDALKGKSLKEETKILESLKASLKDWEVLDVKIDEANQKIEEVESKNKMLSHRNKLQSLFNSYGQDEELLMNMVQESCNKITKSEVAHLRSVTAEYMANEGKFPKEIFSKISEKFKERSQQLGN